jgi:predicted DNA-binding transcriptional regulator AlpA
VVRRVPVSDLVGAAEIAERLGVGKSTVVHDWRRRYEDFPQPVAELSAGMVWAWTDVEKWALARSIGSPREPDPRRAVKINHRLGSLGMNPTEVTHWWSHEATESLGNRTPLQAWQRGEYEAVEKWAKATGRTIGQDTPGQ